MLIQMPRSRRWRAVPYCRILPTIPRWCTKNTEGERRQTTGCTSNILLCNVLPYRQERLHQVDASAHSRNGQSTERRWQYGTWPLSWRSQTWEVIWFLKAWSDWDFQYPHHAKRTIEDRRLWCVHIGEGFCGNAWKYSTEGRVNDDEIQSEVFAIGYSLLHGARVAPWRGRAEVAAESGCVVVGNGGVADGCQSSPSRHTRRCGDEV